MNYCCSLLSKKFVDNKIIYGIKCPKILINQELNLSSFEFITALGHGYASTIFHTIHKKTKINCVLKVCMKTRLNLKEEERIRREIDIHSTIWSKEILTLYASIEDNQAFYLILEYANNGDLFSLIKKKNVNNIINITKFLNNIYIPILLGVSHLHEKNIIHRDIKPENILIVNDLVKICDFGLSIDCYKERPNSLVGTIEYMAPEFFTGNTIDYTSAVDIWSLGVLLYECLTGISPFIRENNEEIEINIKNINYDKTLISPNVQEFLSHILVYDPTKRYNINQLLKHEFIASNN